MNLETEMNQISQAYCTERNSHKVVDTELLEDIKEVALRIAREYAEECMKKLVDDLFVNGSGENAEYLKMYDVYGQYIGGWSKFGAQSRIKKVLEVSNG